MLMRPENLMTDGMRSAHVIVVGNEKGGTGKSTTCINILVSLLKAGQKVASIDLDSRQGTLTSFLENRKSWSVRMGLDLELPHHFALHELRTDQVSLTEEAGFAAFAEAIDEVEYKVDFVIIDTPANDSYLMRLAHSVTDTLVTPMNSSLVDFDVLAKIDPISSEILSLSHYARMVREGRRQRRILDDGSLDWVIVRNRLSVEDALSESDISESLRDLTRRLGFRMADSIAARPIFRELFLKGLTALDRMDEETLGSAPKLAHLAARQEVRSLMTTLKLPINERASQCLDAKKTWREMSGEPLELHDILER